MTYHNTTTAYITYTDAEMAEREAHAARVAWANTMRLRLDRDSRRTVLRAWGVSQTALFEATRPYPSGPVIWLIDSAQPFPLTRKVQR